jgi:hypothetical protein
MPEAFPVEARIEAGAELADALAVLLPLENDLAYGNFAPIASREGATLALHAARWQRSDDEIATFVARDGDGQPLVAARLDARPFESQHFELPMAAIDAPVGVADGERRQRALAALLKAAFACARERGIAHVAVRASARDIATSRAAQQLGAAHVGTQVSWMLSLDGHPHEGLPPGFTLETKQAGELTRSDPPTWKRIAEWGARAFDRSPYAFDASLPYARSLAVYQVWTEKVMRGEWCDQLVLVRHQEEVVAFISHQLLRDVSEAAGVRVIGRCLAATLPEYRGLATACVREISATRPLGASYLEGETPVTTLGTVNLFARTGFRYLRATATFHRRLDRRHDA